MLKGFYNLTSGMLTQQSKLDTISNNMSNVSTPGYKKDVLTSRTFKEELLYRTGNVDKSNPFALASTSKIRVPDEVVTNFEQGSFDETGRTFDFALASDGFFQIQTDQGVRYTRNGSFTLDDQGYLYSQPAGRVSGQQGAIFLGTDKFTVDQQGRITLDDGTVIDQIQVVAFNDNQQLIKSGEGLFQNPDPANARAAETPVFKWKMLERSNVAAADEMSEMILSQRAIQSNAQILKMYDVIMDKIASDIGRV